MAGGNGHAGGAGAAAAALGLTAAGALALRTAAHAEHPGRELADCIAQRWATEFGGQKLVVIPSGSRGLD